MSTFKLTQTGTQMQADLDKVEGLANVKSIGSNLSLSSGGELSANDTGATSVEVTGSGNAVTSASYSASTRKISLSKGTTFATSTQLAAKQDALTWNPTIPSGATTTSLTAIKDGSNYYSLGGGDSLPKVTIATSQVISQNPLQIQLTNEQYTTMNGQSVIFDGSALGMSVVVADYNGTYIDDNDIEYLTFIFPYSENSDNIDFYKILVNKSTKVAGLDSAYPQRAINADFADTVRYDTSAPTSANTSGGLKVVVLSEEPATRYDGYLYIITESSGFLVDVRWYANQGYTYSDTSGGYAYDAYIYDGAPDSGILIGKLFRDNGEWFVSDTNNVAVTGPFSIKTGIISFKLLSTDGDNPGFGISGGEAWVVSAEPASSFDLTNNTSGSHTAGFILSIPVTGNGTLYMKDSVICLVEGTLVTLANGNKKAIEDISYDDDILVYDFYDSKTSVAKPFWIAEPLNATFYYKTELSNGTVLKNAGPYGHRMFNYTKQSFMYPKDFEKNDVVLLENGKTATIVSNEIVHEKVKVYNVITDTHYNLYAENVLTSCRLSNVYPIQNMKYDTTTKLMSDKEIDEYMEHLEKTRLKQETE